MITSHVYRWFTNLKEESNKALPDIHDLGIVIERILVRCEKQIILRRLDMVVGASSPAYGLFGRRDEISR